MVLKTLGLIFDPVGMILGQTIDNQRENGGNHRQKLKPKAKKKGRSKYTLRNGIWGYHDGLW